MSEYSNYTIKIWGVIPQGITESLPVEVFDVDADEEDVYLYSVGSTTHTDAYSILSVYDLPDGFLSEHARNVHELLDEKGFDVAFDALETPNDGGFGVLARYRPGLGWHRVECTSEGVPIMSQTQYLRLATENPEESLAEKISNFYGEAFNWVFHPSTNS